MKKNNPWRALLILMALPGTAAAGVLDLPTAVETAIENNHVLGAADAELRAAEAAVLEAASSRMPRVELSETFLRTTNPVYVFGNLLGQESFGPENFDPAFLNEPDALNNWNTKLTVTQPVWTGGRIRGGIDASRLARETARAARERTRQEVVHRVIETYTGAVLANHHLQVAREALETTRAHVKIVSDMFEAGLVVESDLLQARVRESEIEEMVIRAGSAVEIARAALNLAMGRDLDVPIELPETLEPRPEGDQTLESLVEQAVASRPDLEAAESRARTAERMIRIQKAGYLPEVGLVGSYEANAEDFVGGDGTNWSVMAAARFTVFDGRATRARVRQARERHDGARRMNEFLRHAVGLEVRQAWYEVQAARKRLEQTVRAVEMSGESLRIVEDRYREGLVTLVELLEAENALTRARTREVAARRDLLTGQATLDLAVGRL
jgi:outer membrane protein TolC